MMVFLARHIRNEIIEFSLLFTTQSDKCTTKKNPVYANRYTNKKQNQVFHHSQVISVRPTSEKPMWYYNGRNQFIPMKISFTMNFIGMIRMQMKRITSKFLYSYYQFLQQFPIQPILRFVCSDFMI